MRVTFFLGLVAALAATGCDGSGHKFVPVSGQVTLNGKPLADAYVEFQPIAASKDADPGPGSRGKTDKDGRFTLASTFPSERNGAVVGKHQVRIGFGDEFQNADVDAESGLPKDRKSGRINLPGRYHVDSQLTFDVPEGGTDKADFQLTLP